MKKMTTITALAAAAMLSATPMLATADDDYWGERYEHRRDGKSMGPYSTEEMRIMANGQALRRFGPGVKASVDETPDGTYRVQLRDAEQKLIREQEYNQYGNPVRGPRRD